MTWHPYFEDALCPKRTDGLFVLFALGELGARAIQETQQQQQLGAAATPSPRAHRGHPHPPPVAVVLPAPLPSSPAPTLLCTPFDSLHPCARALPALQPCSTSLPFWARSRRHLRRSHCLSSTAASRSLSMSAGMRLSTPRSSRSSRGTDARDDPAPRRALLTRRADKSLPSR